MVRVSALQGEGIDDLLRCISEKLLLQFIALDMLIPYDRGDLVALLHQFGTVAYEGYEEGAPTCAGMSRPTTAGRSPHLQSGWRPPNGCARDACFDFYTPPRP